MKNIFLYALVLLALASCKKSFTERPSLDQPTVATYYNTAAQVKGATGTLYGLPWFDYQDKAFACIGEVMGGNSFTGDGAYAPFMNFSVSSTDPRLGEAWNAFYRIMGSANVLINTFEDKKKLGGSAAILDPGIAEARFIRGVSVFFIARIWGDAPIVTDPGKLAVSGEFQIPRYLQEDLLRFATEDLQYAEANLPETAEKGRVTKFSAKGMMAKIYLYKKDYANAKLKAGEVIASNKFQLFPDYHAMFSASVNNNNSESLFALQWVNSSQWGSQNSLQAYTAPANLLITSDGWSSTIPSLDLLAAYAPGDKRRKWSIMEHGNTYPSWKPVRPATSANDIDYNDFMKNGYIYDTGSTPRTIGNPLLNVRNSSRANFSKYVVGPGSATEPVEKQKTQINTYLLRYADVLLIYAEATLGTSASTSDAAALAAFNQVHNGRAGLPVATSLTADIIFKERRVEFAFEGDFWFDIQRQGFAKAQAIIAAQERGQIDYTRPGGINSFHATLSLPYKQLFLPIPLSEVTQNPKLNEPAVHYY
ncbi:MAG: RagB/SusD family nutrient uptake outer membrane protein [Ferruginibacter sp.]|nr:RagB/SusD family nutrient uptake outer membrane protein [Chitinophagaceae bacterium]